MIDFQFIGTQADSIINNKGWLKKVVSNEGKKIGEIVFVFCTDDFLLEKNIQFLNHETLTDVITFDYCDGDVISGDILISIDRVEENSKIFNVKFFNELDRVMLHGLLHLLGYGDKNKRDSKIMRARENFYLSIK